MSFETKDSGKREDYPSGMRRDTQEGKARYDLIDLDFLTRWAELMARGAEKYGEDNWRLADSEEELRRFKASAFRHFIKWFKGELDEDHGAAVAFNIAAAEMVKKKLFEEKNKEFRRKLLARANDVMGINDSIPRGKLPEYEEDRGPS